MVDFEQKLQGLELSLSFDDILIKPAKTGIILSEVDLSLRLSEKFSLKLPVFSAAMDTVTGFNMSRAMISAGACGPLNRNLGFTETILSIKKLKEEFGDTKPIIVTVGVSTPKENIEEFVKSGANSILVDSSHAHSDNVGNLVSYISKNYPNIYLIAGNVVTKEGAKYLIDLGAHAVKVGLGAGSICTTRKVTGIGRGQVTSIAEVADYCHKNNTLVIADGGIRATDDIVKAIAVGADAVMLGYMLSGCNECPGDIVEIEGEKYKYYRGMGSKKAMEEGSKDRYNKASLSGSKLVSAGIESYVKARGSVVAVLEKIEWSLRSAFGYMGANNIKEAQDNSCLIRVTNNVSLQSSTHSIDKVINSKE